MSVDGVAMPYCITSVGVPVNDVVQVRGRDHQRLMPDQPVDLNLPESVPAKEAQRVGELVERPPGGKANLNSCAANRSKREIDISCIAPELDGSFTEAMSFAVIRENHDHRIRRSLRGPKVECLPVDPIWRDVDPLLYAPGLGKTHQELP